MLARIIAPQTTSPRDPHVFAKRLILTVIALVVLAALYFWAALSWS